MEKDGKDKKPKYNMWQNSAFMVGLSWRFCKSVVLLLVAAAVSSAGLSIAEVLVSPVLLSKIESYVPFSELIAYIAMFVGILAGLSAIKAYIGENTLYGRIQVRSGIIGLLGEKIANTSYPNTLDSDFFTLQDKSMNACSSNQDSTEAVWKTLEGLLSNVICFVVYLLLLSNLNLWMVALVLATTVASYFARKNANEWSYRHREELNRYAKKLHYLSNVSMDRVFSKDIRLFGLKAWIEDLYACSRRAHVAFLGRQEMVGFGANVVDMVMTFLRNAIAYVYLIKLTLDQGLPASQFLLYFNVLTGFTQWMNLILSGLSTLHRQSLDLSMIREFLDWPEVFKFEEGKPLSSVAGMKYEIRLDDVSFRYPKEEKPILEHINLTIAPDEKLAVVGLNGAGKTTLVKIICGLLDPTNGRVLLNGEDIRQYNRIDYYRMFSAVFQDFSVVDVSVRQNVAQCTEGIDDEKVWRCLDDAGLTDKVKSLPRGLDTPVGRSIYEDGVEFSGGQTQRLMLARALYKDAPIVILDEPTAALDPIAESEIYQKYSDMTNGKPSIFISHRLASTRFCDRILFVADGGIKEEGTHDELLAKGGEYSKLFEVQSKYYRKEVEDER